ncbi:aminotransferase class IV [Halorientalis regularis]|jgi:branched-chain amino acid aminotransferase|uniref:Branched chain amino acid aminotransferase apoenzyme n=1 Tax=Halorientalis regularis TaxID=660518 RepID=A0A1G7IMN2_9EURY|nr:aminotransferase class IV [Halorientalis regularis]SDF13893.1 branched chain amino acid aminotransferase apoenzyme [Halorientalis regularis]
MQDSYQYHVDGEIVPAADATISVRDRGFMYGDAAFETLRAYGGTVFAWDAHETRLRNTCDLLGFPEAVPDDLRERVQATLDANDLDDAYVRLSVSRGIQPGKLTPDPDVDPTVVVLVKELPRGGVEGTTPWDDPAVVQTVKTRRTPDAASPAAAKTHNYLNGIRARLELRRAETDAFRADEALLRTTDDAVAEGATSNVFFVDGGVLKTPSEDCDILPGVTRDAVIELAREEEFPVEPGRYEIGDVRDADEAFLTNTTWEIRPIASVDGIEIGTGPMTKLLSRLFEERVERDHYE